MRIRLSLTLSEEQQRQLTLVKTALRNDSKVQALGGLVTDAVALRYVLFTALESPDIPKATPVGEPMGPYTPQDIEELSPKAAEPEPKVEVGTEPTPENGSDSEATVEPDEKPLVPEVYSRPPEWQYSDEGLWDFPDSQTEMHSYYIEHGWMRVAAQLEDRVLQFYWTPEGPKQALSPYKGLDAYKRSIDVQKSPDVGVAHMIPEDWDEPRGNTGDIGMWSPGG